MSDILEREQGCGSFKSGFIAEIYLGISQKQAQERESHFSPFRERKSLRETGTGGLTRALHFNPPKLGCLVGWKKTTDEPIFNGSGESNRRTEVQRILTVSKIGYGGVNKNQVKVILFLLVCDLPPHHLHEFVM